ncbi:MAG TPA: response regulator, partial [Labilithrix sp.]|nr:response regulator [Labilithrix sp.]
NGFSVHEAVSGSELLSVLRSVTADSWPLDGVDLIVLDNRMPGMTGLEAIRNLRAAHWETPAILMTAFPDAAVKREAQRLGVPVLPKPFSLDLLSSAVLVVLLSRHAPADDSLSRP